MEVRLATKEEILMDDIKWAIAYGESLDAAAKCAYEYWIGRAKEETINVDEFRGLIRAYGLKTVIHAIEDTLYDQSSDESDGMYSNTFWNFMKVKHEA